MANGLQVDFLMAGVMGTNNKPLAYGKVYTYAAGSTSASSVYTDATLTTAATNPIILDERGSANVYASGYYKFVIKDKNDVTIETYDNLYYVVAETETTSVTSISSEYTTTSNAELIKVNTAGGSVTLNLVSAVGNGGLRFIIIKTSASNTLTVDPNSSETINGSATYAMTANNETLEIMSDNVNWVIVNTPASGAITASSADTLTNKTFTDNVTTFQDNADNTKKFQFQVSGVTTGQTRTLTVPDADATIATLTGTETLTNKTVTAPVLSGTVTGTYTLGGTPTITTPTITVEAWTGVSFGSNWANFSAYTCSYMKDPMGFVHLKGVAVSSGASGNTVLTLPSNYRPEQGYVKPAAHYISTNTSSVTIGTNGVVSVASIGSGEYVYLDGITFRPPKCRKFLFQYSSPSPTTRPPYRTR